jgi:hypothetical protein
VCKSTQWEFSLYHSTSLFYKGLPHQSTRCVVREGEVNSLVEELFKVFLVAFLRLVCATDNSNSRLVSYPSFLPFKKRFLKTHWLKLHFSFSFLFLSLLLFLFGGPDFMSFININNCWLKFLSNHETHSN